MKPVVLNAMNAKNLDLRKKTISVLSNNQMNAVAGGEAAITSSWFVCTGWECCHTKTTSIVAPEPPAPAPAPDQPQETK